MLIMDYLCDRALLSMIYPSRAQMLLYNFPDFKKYMHLVTAYFKPRLCCIAGIIFCIFFSYPAS